MVVEGPHQTSSYIAQVGMVVSNEPGFYLDGSFGIRIENLLEVVEKARRPPETGVRGFVLTHGDAGGDAQSLRQ